MEAHNLQAASTYVNNILLARGLLKSGSPIDFAEPDNEEGGTAATMARIINLVNDLVLRRDREADHRESLATTIRALRVTETEQTTEIGKLKTKSSELSRSLALAEAQQRTLNSNMTNAETTIRGLKEQSQRMKATVQQVRAQCANDVRKRDLEMQKLKSHLAERQRGKREGGGERVHDPQYNLKEETTEFLTELCQNLSDENDTLIELARNTVDTLKELQGLPETEDGKEEEALGVSTGVGHGKSTSAVTSLPTSCEELSLRMHTVLDHLQTLLTNPSFVPLEEVELRDEEIIRLREGWEKMETRWKQAVTMMDGWQRRLADGGGSVQVEELTRGMNLDLSFTSTEDVSMQSRDGAHTISPIIEDQEDVPMSEAEDSTVAEAPNPPKTRSKIRKVPERSERALKERSDNATLAAKPKRHRKVSFTPGLAGSPAIPSPDVAEENLQIKTLKSEAVTRRSSRRKSDPKTTRQTTGAEPRMSVRQKLAAAEDEARTAEQARKEGETRKRSRPEKTATRSSNRRRSTLTIDELEDLMGVPSR
ncbi:hypothetical protein N7533_003463 [Penicillium manginii]|uniref:uncharacterized protein n=1 Tax=Penicillium manginii TaxID=203109 RepID=UPI002548DD10|nr:uncharacterized protein N7533_003463 [Penicillium manginii]KAJ5761424.1 hypothetical protein N7533_003463 [Penicillium manginii]